MPRLSLHIERYIDEHSFSARNMRLFAIECSERALLREERAGKTVDERSVKLPEVARRYINGEAEYEELRRAASRGFAAVPHQNRGGPYATVCAAASCFSKSTPAVERATKETSKIAIEVAKVSALQTGSSLDDIQEAGKREREIQMRRLRQISEGPYPLKKEAEKGYK